MNLSSILVVWNLMYFQPMIISSLFVSFVPIAVIILQCHEDLCHHKDGATVSQVIKRLCQSFLVLITAVLATVLLNQVFKVKPSKLFFLNLLFRFPRRNKKFRQIARKADFNYSHGENNMGVTNDGECCVEFKYWCPS